MLTVGARQQFESSAPSGTISISSLSIRKRETTSLGLWAFHFPCESTARTIGA